MDSLEQLHLASPGSRFLNSTPSLYVVATPLGNLFDISCRALGVLANVDAVAAEDTRHTRRLFDHHGINTRLLAVHQHNEQAAADGLVALLEQGQQIALVTDAGTPAVSDPGARVVARVQAAGFPVIPVPGPSAVITALSASGITDPHFLFVGFLPSRQAARRSELEHLTTVDAALVFYEAPHRVLECVEDLIGILGEGRELTIARELTKVHEQIVRIPLTEASHWFAADPNRLRGEFVLIVSAPPPDLDIPPAARRLLELLLEDLPVSRAARIAAEATGVAKKKLYELGLELKPEA